MAPFERRLHIGRRVSKHGIDATCCCVQLLQILPAGTPKEEALEREQPEAHAGTK